MKYLLFERQFVTRGQGFHVMLSKEGKIFGTVYNSWKKLNSNFRYINIHLVAHFKMLYGSRQKSFQPSKEFSY